MQDSDYKNEELEDSNVPADDTETLTGMGDADSVHEIELEGSVWEDVPNVNSAQPNEQRLHSPSPAPSSLSSRDSSIRKRRGRTQFIARPASTRRTLVKLRSNKGNSSPLVEIDPDRVKDAIATGTSNSFHYILDVFSNAMRFLRWPLAILCALWILSFALTKLADSIRTVFSPFCWIPGISSTPVCYIADISKPRWADYPKLTEVQSTTFEQLLDEAVGSSGLSLEVKKAEMATADLITLVKVSDLRSRDLIIVSLEDFVSDAKAIGRSLQKLNSKVSGALDSIIAVNDHALHTIEAQTAKSESVFSLIWPFGTKSDKVIAESFADSLNVASTQMERVILEAEVNLANLDRLERRLITLHDIVQRENVHISNERSELLAELWTILGGNKRRVRNLDGHLYLLRSIGQYRTRALAHVVATMQTVQVMSGDMEDLRERVNAPELVGDRIPPEVHIKSIQAGIDRLVTKRYQAGDREEAAIRQILGGVDEPKL